MFKNAGRKIKVLARILFWIGVVCWILIAAGIAFGGSLYTTLFKDTNGFTQELNFSGPGMIIAGVAAGLVGILATWLESLFVYGFGELIDNTARINRRLGRGGAHSEE